MMSKAYYLRACVIGLILSLIVPIKDIRAGVFPEKIQTNSSFSKIDTSNFIAARTKRRNKRVRKRKKSPATPVQEVEAESEVVSEPSDEQAESPKEPLPEEQSDLESEDMVYDSAPTEDTTRNMSDKESATGVRKEKTNEQEFGQEEEIEEVDFEEEEIESDKQSKRIMSGHGRGTSQGPGAGFKLFVDFLADYRLGKKKQLVFRANHFYVLVQAQVKDDLSFLIHVSDDPVLYELTWNITPRIAFKAGKILVPFGTNEFHHIIGGRVDELSHFLPETWGDFGFGISHVLYDGDYVNAEYTAYAINGFEGAEEPLLGNGDMADNNINKGLGTRLKLGFFSNIVLTSSLYYDAWDPKGKYKLLFYALGAELRPGLINVPILRKLRLRGEWGRGEIELPKRNMQRGITNFAWGKGGYYTELSYPVLDNLMLRFRMGRINPDNRIQDEGDVDVWEPALLLSFGKVALTFAYQMVGQVGRPYRTKKPADVIYTKFFLQY